MMLMVPVGAMVVTVALRMRAAPFVTDAARRSWGRARAPAASASAGAAGLGRSMKATMRSASLHGFLRVVGKAHG